MTIQEAIKSGKYFKRPHHRYWYAAKIDGDYYDILKPDDEMWDDGGYEAYELDFRPSEILADDWKVLEQ